MTTLAWAGCRGSMLIWLTGADSPTKVVTQLFRLGSHQVTR